MSHIGRELAEARNRAGLTQLEFAERLGVLQSRVSRIEHQANPRLDTVQSYARALGLELVLVPRKQLGRVRAMLSDSPGAPADDGRSRFPSLADLIGSVPKESDSRPRRGGGSR
jgi:transcriptional regulator with XRE-family HTH domain